MAKFQDLYEFIDRAVKSRKYPENTASGLRAALKLFETALNDDELSSLEVFKQNLEQIYGSVSSKNGKNFSASSLAVYKSRVSKVINDFEKYGIDPTKMASWSPKVVTRSPKNVTKVKKSSQDEVLQPDSSEVISGVEMVKVYVPLRPGIKSICDIPVDITKEDLEKIKIILGAYVMNK